MNLGDCYTFKMVEGCGNDRSVMPLDVQGCTRTTLI